MEGVIVIILLIVGWAIFKMFLSAGARTIGAAGKAAMGKGSFSENMDLAFKGMEAFDVRFENTRLNDDGTGPLVKEIQGKGLFPVQQTKNIGFITSVFDKTGGDFEPVIAAIDSFQEPDSITYQHLSKVGKIEPNQGFIRWFTLGVVIPEVLQPPYSGSRNMVAVIRMVDLDNLPNIHHGFHQENDSRIIWQKALDFDYDFDDKGYQEASEHRDESVSLSLKIAMAVAMADGSLDDSEGNVLKEWIKRAIEPFTDDKKDRLKNLYNDAMRDSYADASAGQLSLSELTERLNEIGEKSVKYETLELCFDIMAADGVADEGELTIIRKIAEALGLEMDEIEKMRDEKIVGLNTSVSNHASIEVILGIDPEWSDEAIKKHLRTEFLKWNNRLNALDAGDERQNAQLMLDRIAVARKKYA